MHSLHISRKCFHLWPLGFLCFDFETSFWILVLGMSEIQKLRGSGCPSAYLSWPGRNYVHVVSMKPPPRGSSVNVHGNVVKLEQTRASYLKYAFQALLATSVQVQRVHETHFFPSSTYFSSRSFSLPSWRYLNLDQADREPWFPQVCKMQILSDLGMASAAQAVVRCFQVQALLLCVSKMH